MLSIRLLMKCASNRSLVALSRSFTTIHPHPEYTSKNPISKEEFSIWMKECHMDYKSTKPIVLAISGGPDSMALLYLMKQWTSPKRLVAVTVDHGFRSESEEEAKKVHSWVEQMNIHHKIMKIDWTNADGPPQESQLEKEGRKRRYELIKMVCNEYNTPTICLAHHGDDAMETFIMRYYRYSGVIGLGCMNAYQEEDGITKIRPLLKTSKERLLQTCHSNRIPFVIDPSNANLQYDRNRIRHGLAQLRKSGSFDILSILDVISYFSSIRSYVDKKVDLLLHEAVEYNPRYGICRFNRAVCAAYDDLVLMQLFKLLCSSIGEHTIASEKAINRIISFIKGKDGIPKTLQVGGCLICEMKLNYSFYTKHQQNSWYTICVDKKQISSIKENEQKAILKMNKSLLYADRYCFEASPKPARCQTVVTLPLITKAQLSSPLFVSYLSDADLQYLLCNNRGLLSRKGINRLCARSIPSVFAKIDGKKQVVFSSILGIHRIQDITIEMKTVSNYIFDKCGKWTFI